MNRRSFVMTGVAALVAAPAAVRAQGLVVCRKCGREAKPGEATCSHCGAELPKSRVAEAAAEPVVPKTDKGAETVRLAVTVMEDSLKQARELEGKQPEVALVYYQNALALMRLAPAGSQPAGVGAAILEGTGARCRRCSAGG